MLTHNNVQISGWAMNRYHKRRCIVLCCICALLLVYGGLSLSRTLISRFCPWTASEREFIVKELQSVISDLRKNAPRQVWTAETQQKLLRVINLFDFLYEHPNFSNQILPSDKNANLAPDVCPERYLHFNLSEPYYLKGSWAKEKGCRDQASLEQLLTIILVPNTLDRDCQKNVQHLLKTIEQYNPRISVIVGITEIHCDITSSGQVRVVNIRSGATAGQVWNTLIGSVSTPFVLIGRDLDIVSWFSRFERQLSILTTDAMVKVVGGSFRNKTGHWQIGCLQSTMQHYRLQYIDGYFASRNECVFCDHLLGPFIAKTSLFHMIKFDELLPGDVIFEDLFIRLKHNSLQVMNCPDAMYFVDERIPQFKSWLQLAKKWELNRVVLPEGVTHKFSCEEMGMKCSDLHPISARRFMPTCCMDRVLSGLKALHQFCQKHNLIYYVNGGTLLGAVKFRNVIPWDFDGDAIYYLSNLTTFLKYKENFSNDLKKIFLDDVHLKWFGYFRVKLPDIFIEMDGLNSTANEKTDMNTNMFQLVPTKVMIRGEWFYAPPSPGLYVRNMYGNEYFKHANSWQWQGHLWFDPYDMQRYFFQCDNPNHHACYDYLPTDGSFYFITP